MPLIIGGGSEIDDLTIDGVSLDSLVVDGTEVWRKMEAGDQLSDGSYVLGVFNGYWLIVAPNDETEPAYGGVYDYPLYTGSTVDGVSNTVSMVNKVNAGLGTYNPDDGKTPNAAILCDDKTTGGHTDWYLPAIDELYFLWSQRNVLTGGLSGIGIITSTSVYPDPYYYLSSSVQQDRREGSNKLMKFDDGNPGYGSRRFQYNVRAFRRIPA
ncbi:DUF1566 domain-containing protein [Halomonas llamarensis]|uniref:DUF1566 domain-containing protein n=1 Tax=Halomonas llamarensis TaxID=2945104 RepID=A0ABT0SRK7_9GAMM|nr:DUF1566 domain-containing protein [Halomonas llamarensis]MCL7930443.1 DUF1566 domain-containing protein [Halomonas llamarensis]